MMELPVTSGGIRHVLYGLLQSHSERIIYVTLDRHETVGQRIWVFDTPTVQARLQEALDDCEPLILGSTEANSQRDTGGGYLFTPDDMGGDEYPLPPDLRSLGDGEPIILTWIVRKYSLQTRKATKAEQLRGIDVVVPACSAGIEVKTRKRHQSFAKLYFQVTEANIDRRHHI